MTIICNACYKELTEEEASDYDLIWKHSGDMYCIKCRKCPDDCRRTPCILERKTFSFDEIEHEQLGATDLRNESSKHQDAKSFLVLIDGSLENAYALYLPREGRMGIAWGSDATWADVGDVEEGISLFLHEPDKWKSRN